MKIEFAELPIDMLLFCPRCDYQHVDAPQPEKGWDNPPHRSHECQHCGCIWRPADVATNGVRSITTRGKADNWMAANAAPDNGNICSDCGKYPADLPSKLCVGCGSYKEHAAI